MGVGEWGGRYQKLFSGYSSKWRCQVSLGVSSLEFREDVGARNINLGKSTRCISNTMY